MVQLYQGSDSESHPEHRQQQCLDMMHGPTKKVDVRLPGKGNSNSHGARPVHLIITMTKWIRTSRLSIKNSLCTDLHDVLEVDVERVLKLRLALVCSVQGLGFTF